MSKATIWGTVFVVFAGTGGYLTGVTPAAKRIDPNDRPECPHHWGEFELREHKLQKDTGDLVSARTVVPAAGSAPAQFGFKLPNDISDVPEYHDCQRMREVDGGAAEYGSLIAVFAGDSLAYMDSSVFNEPRAVAEVFISDAVGGYAKLRIVNTFSCLVLQRLSSPTGREIAWNAWMVPVRRQDQCTQRFVPGTDLIPEFALHVVASPPPANSMVPAVARWEWDEKAKTQLIGVRCGNKWCQVGPKGFTPAAAYSASGATGQAKANIEIKGYFDEQQLAEFPQGQPMRPGENLGTLVPSPVLTTAMRGGVESYHGEWVHVADVYMRPKAGDYAKSLNFTSDAAAPPGARHARVSLCRSGSKQCRPSPPYLYFKEKCHKSPGDGEIWYGKISQADKWPKYFCVVYRAHKGAQIPPVARWRWRVDDEGIWVSCPDGCCEVNADEY